MSLLLHPQQDLVEVCLGPLIGTAHEMGLSIENVARAMLAAGIIGFFIAEHATFTAEVWGC